MPRKSRDLIADLQRVGFQDAGGLGSHRNFVQSEKGIRVTLSGQLGADAKPYPEKLVAKAIKDAEA